MDVKLIGNWVRDWRAFDPSAMVRTVEVDGYLFTVRNTMGPGWPMHLYPEFSDGPQLHISTVSWEDWNEVAAKAREFLASV